MKWLALALQLLTFRSSLVESKALMESAKGMAEKGRRALLLAALGLLALIYFLAGSILLVVELGLQVDRGDAFHFSGLVGSSILLMVLSPLLLSLGLFFTRSKSPPPPPPPPPRSDLRAELEKIAVAFLTRFLDKLGEGKRPT